MNTVSTDGALHAAMRQIHLEEPGHEVQLEGRTYGEQKLHERVDRPIDAARVLLLGGTKEEVEHFGVELAEHAFETGAEHAAAHGSRALEHAMSAATTFTAVGGVLVDIGGKAKVVIECQIEALHEGELEEAARVREHAIAACVALCKAELPPGFCDETYDRLMGRAPSQQATRIYQAVTSRPDAKEVVAGMNANCLDGQRTALDRGLGTARDVETARRYTPGFADKYDHDLAFRLGVDSAVWAAQTEKLDEMRARVAAATPSALQVRG